MQHPLCVVGLGIIGSIWLRHHLQDGRSVRAWNRTPRPDIPEASVSLAEAAHGAGMAHIVVADPEAVQAVLTPLCESLAPGSLIVQSSTISPAAAEAFAEQARAAGHAYLEAPFTGSQPAAEARQLIFFTGGDGPALERARPLLTPLSRLLFCFETPARAAAMKLAMNLQIAAVSIGLCEGRALARAHGLEDAAFFEVLRCNVAHSGLADLKEPKLRSGDFRPQFSVKHMAKDLRLAREAAAGLGLRLPLTDQSSARHEQGLRAGLGDLDFIALAQLLEQDQP